MFHFDKSFLIKNSSAIIILTFSKFRLSITASPFGKHRVPFSTGHSVKTYSHVR